MILDLDDQRAVDPTVAGAKASWLARGRRVGLPVLPGFVIATEASLQAMSLGARALGQRGSGGARSAIWSVGLDEALAAAVQARAGRLGEPLIVRSSSVLEGDGRWSGAFSSFLDIGVADIGSAICGCWASAFSVSALARYAAEGIEPGTVGMAVLVQPAIEPASGGVARLDGEEVRITAIEGSPVPLMQGWESGVVARVGSDRQVLGDGAIERIGPDVLRAVGDALRGANDRIGATACEWAWVDGKVILLQMSQPRGAAAPLHAPRPSVGLGAASERLARIVRRAPGPLGEALVLPWAIAERSVRDEPDAGAPASRGQGSLDRLRLAREESGRLMSDVWGVPEAEAAERSRELFRILRSSESAAALPILDGLREPDAGRADLVRSLVRSVRFALADAGEVASIETAWYVTPDRASEVLAAGATDRRLDRVGVDRWEPFVGAVVSELGQRVVGTAASPGLGFGRLCYIGDVARGEHFRPRDVIVTSDPLPGLGALLWDAAGIITTSGGPAAHLFEAARSLGLAAVCGADLDSVLGVPLEVASGRFAVAVDGSTGTVDVTAW